MVRTVLASATRSSGATSSSGPIRVGDHVRVGANAFVVNRDVAPRSTVVGTPARIVKLDGRRVDAELPRMAPPSGAVSVELEL